eukprot:TRINITY_DN16700_c0_g1_i1.p1 TRINITY_DN16700_c0_g1~~TRINITY_DN16700_c0_g1_i1.p1  ORF type:complete len:184 (-),score=56.73 TRINITY_DN16700_c0_g1_i1:132-683(-)
MSTVNKQFLHEYQVVGRLSPTEAQPTPKIYRMRLFSQNEVRAKSRFWYFLSSIHKVKRATGEILLVNEIFEKRPQQVKNFAIFLRYNSRSGTHNMYKEYRDVTRTGAVEQMYLEMAGRHRARFSSIQVIDVKTIAASKAVRPNTVQFLDSKVKFPLAHRLIRGATRSENGSKFKAHRPTTHFN